jgi:hypothetical protein
LKQELESERAVVCALQRQKEGKCSIKICRDESKTDAFSIPNSL